MLLRAVELQSVTAASFNRSFALTAALAVQLPTIAALQAPCLQHHVPAPHTKRRQVIACSAELASVTKEQYLLKRSVRVVRAMIRALLLLVGWTPLATTGLTINLLSRLHIVPSAVIEAWWSAGRSSPQQIGTCCEM